MLYLGWKEACLFSPETVTTTQTIQRSKLSPGSFASHVHAQGGGKKGILKHWVAHATGIEPCGAALLKAQIRYASGYSGF